MGDFMGPPLRRSRAGLVNTAKLCYYQDMYKSRKLADGIRILTVLGLVFTSLGLIGIMIVRFMQNGVARLFSYPGELVFVVAILGLFLMGTAIYLSNMFNYAKKPDETAKKDTSMGGIWASSTGRSFQEGAKAEWFVAGAWFFSVLIVAIAIGLAYVIALLRR